MAQGPMKRREFLKTLGLATAGMAMGQTAHSAGGSSEDLPNVLLIISDDQAWTDYSFMGHEHIRSPNLDHLASQSRVYTRGYVTTALCCPSLATLTTGLYPHQHHITGNDPVKGPRDPLNKKFAECPRVPLMLQEQDYLSFQSGKWWMDSYELGGFTHGMTTHGRHGGPGLKIGREGMQPLYDFVDMTQEREQPFFIWYAPFLPHRPHNPPQRLLKKYKDAGPRKKYFAMCEWFDETCGQLLDYLDEKGVADNTLVLYLEDNGWPIGGDWSKQPGKGGKGSPYERGVRSIYMIRWPGHVEPSMDRETLVSNIDIAPTVLRACGLEPTPEMPGLDLMNRRALAERDTIFLENFAHDMADIDDPAKSLRSRSCIHGDWKLILWEKEQPDLRTSGPPKGEADVELYNLAKDPFEDHNLAEKHPDRVRELTKRINAWWSPR